MSAFQFSSTIHCRLIVWLIVDLGWIERTYDRQASICLISDPCWIVGMYKLMAVGWLVFRPPVIEST